MNILFYSFPHEPITKVIVKNQKKLNVHALYAKDLLDKADIFDIVNHNNVQLNWKIPGFRKITNSLKTKVINRAFSVPDEWFDCFHTEDRKYAKSEFWAYLIFSLESFPNISEKPGISSLTGNAQSLPSQWKIVEDHFQEIHVPEYYIGPVGFFPGDWINEAIYTHAYNYYFWKRNKPNRREKNNVFMVRKPLGEPHLIFVAGETATLHGMENHDNLKISESMRKRLVDFGIKIATIFGFFFSEILVFLKEDSITFAMIHNCPLASEKTPAFEESVIKCAKLFLEK